MKNKGLLGKKLGMTQIFDEEGNRIPVTVVEAGPCVVIDKRTPERDGYVAVQFGFGTKKMKRTSKAEQGHLKKANAGPQRFIREIRLKDPAQLEGYEIGAQIKADIFEQGEIIKVTGISKGKGFSGVMKRHHFSGSPGSHGAHEYFRHGGSIGMHTKPGRVLKGTRMPGQMGNKKVTQKGRQVVQIIPDDNLILIKGPVPGANGGFLILQS